jgi:hypothetical protein
MSDSASRGNRFDPRTPAGKSFWTLYLMLLIFSGIAVLLLLIPGLSKPLYIFLASVISLSDVVIFNIFALNPDPAERQAVTMLFVVLAMAGILLAVGMWLFSIPTSFWLSLSAGLLASQLTAVVIFHYQRQRKLTQK